MSFEKFTDKARKVLVLAQDEARSLHQPYGGTEHILLGLIQEKDGLAAQALDLQGAKPASKSPFTKYRNTSNS